MDVQIVDLIFGKQSKFWTFCEQLDTSLEFFLIENCRILTLSSKLWTFLDENSNFFSHRQIKNGTL